MRTVITKVSTALGALCLFGMSVQAQSYDTHVVVPFSFQAAGKVLPAGDYRVSNTSNTPIVQLRNLKTGRGVFVPTGATGVNSKRGSLRFRQYGNEYFLAGISSSNGLSRFVPMTRREKELTRSKTVEASLVSLAIRAD